VKDQTTKRNNNNTLNLGRKGEIDQGGLEISISIRGGDLVELSSYLV